ncbi:MAG: toll/interleukin-1 receptor domain-containing protein, partial [Synergistaceae bacterium]|nr:toll/interleukin-1 receptor domain-containing protein [Synergistaceae bacterium]
MEAENGTDKKGFEYFAFISYSHKDIRIAKRLKKRLQSYHLPTKLQKIYPTLPKKLGPIFIDEERLTGGVLQEAIRDNLDKSNYLILICSPNSAKSVYVNEEVKHFIETGKTDHIIPFIVDGVPHSGDESKECFPPALLELPLEQELLGIDLKKFGERDSFLRVIATMLELNLDNFVSYEARERKRRAMIFTPIATALMMIMGGLIWYSIEYFNFMQANDAVTQFNLGVVHHSKHDYAKAFEYYQKAAAQGLANAQCNLGYMYRQGIGIEQNYVKAMEWYEKAASQGMADAQYNLGYLYENGLGVKQDYTKAREWFEKSAAQGKA